MPSTFFSHTSTLPYPHTSTPMVTLPHFSMGAGVTTDEIDRIVHDFTLESGAYPSPYNYYNFPKSVCTSVNEVRDGITRDWSYLRTSMCSVRMRWKSTYCQLLYVLYRAQHVLCVPQACRCDWLPLSLMWPCIDLAQVTICHAPPVYM